MAPAALLPGAVARAWRGEGFDKPRDSTANAPKPMTPEEEAKEKANKRFWTLAGVAAMAVSLATGSDAPVFVVFFAQLFKADPSKLMQVMIDKGDPSRAEFDDTIAEGAARLFRRERKDGDRRDDERGSDDAEKPKIARTRQTGDAKSHPLELYDALTANRRAAVVLLLLYVYRY